MGLFDFAGHAMQGVEEFPGQGALREKRTLVDRLNSGLPRFDSEIPEDVRRDIISNELRKLGLRMISGGAQAIPSAVAQGLEDFEGKVTGYQDRVDDREYRQGINEERAQRMEATKIAMEERAEQDRIAQTARENEQRIRQELINKLPTEELQYKWQNRIHLHEDAPEKWHSALEMDIEEFNEPEEPNIAVFQKGNRVRGVDPTTGETKWENIFPENRSTPEKATKLNPKDVIRVINERKSGLERERATLEDILNDPVQRLNAQSSGLLEKIESRLAVLTPEAIKKESESAGNEYIHRFNQITGTGSVGGSLPSDEEMAQEIYSRGLDARNEHIVLRNLTDLYGDPARAQAIIDMVKGMTPTVQFAE